MANLVRKIVKFFDKLEDKVRASLSRHPILYTLIGGVGIVLFWRGVWGITDALSDWLGISILWSNIFSILLSVFMLLITGLFVSFFIGERIILSGLKQEKKVFEKTEEEIKSEKSELAVIEEKLDEIEKDIEEIKAKK